MSSTVQPFAGPFSVREPLFTHGGITLRILLPRSADELIDEGAFERDERLPYWADLWPGARALARWLIDAHPIPNAPPAPPVPPASANPLRVIEVGCGASALASLVLAMRGFNVLATDYEPEALELVEANARRNGVGGVGVANTESLARVRTRMIDWREPPADLANGFDLVLGADLMYEERNAISLAELVPMLLAPGGRVILADPGRRYLPDFLALMRERGFIDREIAIIVEPHHADPARPSSRVQIIEFIRAA